MASGPASPTLRARFRRSLGYRGLRRTLRVGGALAFYHARRGLRAPRPHAFDLEFGTDTVALDYGELVAGADEGNPYEPIDPVDFARVMSGLEQVAIDYRQYDFIDFGCGHGRALMLAAEYPFARVIGIEYARGLLASAERNLESWRRRARPRAGEVSCQWADAGQWALPHRPAVYYFCEPFREPMMWRMAERIRAHLSAAGHANATPGYVLYVGDRYRPAWEQAGDFEIVAAHYYDRAYRYRSRT